MVTMMSSMGEMHVFFYAFEYVYMLIFQPYKINIII